MRLESARALKQELLDRIVRSETSRGTRLLQRIPTAVMGFLASPSTAAAAAPLAKVALGVTVNSSRDFGIAVRVQQHSSTADRIVQRILSSTSGRAEVRFVGPITSLCGPPWHQGRVRPLRIGASIAHFEDTAGTIGCFVSVADSSDRFVLSNSHILARCGNAQVGDDVVQPGPADYGSCPSDVVAGYTKCVHWKPFDPNYVDCAIAALRDDVQVDPDDLGSLGKLRGTVDLDEIDGDMDTLVAKIGRTSGTTRGRISAIEVDEISINVGSMAVRFDGQIEIEGADQSAFCVPGDSGSLVVDELNRAIGLVFAGSSVGGSNQCGFTYANPINAVLSGLDADMIR